MLNLKALQRDGFVEIDDIESNSHLIEIAMAVGRVLPNPDGTPIAKLIANDGQSALNGTFSAKFGLSPFPFHTDTAFYALPVRYLVLGMIGVSENSTRYVKLSDLKSNDLTHLWKLARDSVYLLETFEGARYTSVLFYNNGVHGFRFDPNIMRPVNKAAREFHCLFLEAIARSEIREVTWSGKKAIVFDNWNCLHGRSAVTKAGREILRIYVE